jgi:hypothetical protein
MLVFRIFRLFPLISIFFSTVFAVDGQIKLDKWLSNQDGKPGTWKKTLSWFFKPVPPTDLELYGIAEKCYNWLIANVGAASVGGRDNTVVVAAMYVPTTKNIYVSTIPRGVAKQLVRQDGSKATAWYSHVQAWWPQEGAAWERDSDPPLHAEDGVYFHYETSGGTITSGKYPPGTVIAAYGHIRGGNPGPLSPCSTVAVRNPTCRMVIDALGIRIADPTNVNIAAKRDTTAGVVIEDEENDDTPVPDGILPTCLDAAVRDIKQKARRQAASDSICAPAHYPTADLIETISVSPTAPASPSCRIQNEDPDQGILSGYCVCDGSRTLPLITLAGTAAETASCAYSTLPGISAVTTPAPSLGPATTDPALVVQPAAVTIQAGSSPVNVGTLVRMSLLSSHQLCIWTAS